MRMEDERRWVERCLDGDPEAFRPLVERHQGPVHGLLWRLTGSRDDARELAQEAFLRAYDRLGAYDPARPFGTWIRTIAANLARDRLRRRARGEPRAVPEFPGRAGDAPDPAAEAAREEEAARLREAVSALPRDGRALVEMRYFEGLDLAEIARRTGATRGAVKVRLFRLRKDLLRVLDGSRGTGASG
jgi:RNA polymerase sigma-70 factor (ECF subfamily)